jgi:hypothetical protein
VDAAALLARQFTTRILTPAARRTPQIHNNLTRLNQLFIFIDFFELVSSPCAIAIFLREFYVGVIDMAVQPVLVCFVFCHTRKDTLLRVSSHPTDKLNPIRF